ncbi:Phosphate transport system permease protein PstC [Acaryochloris thomasi RCC1774]|uniref:Phosphate transport system permease protein n=1 Tax=Acaryochloris thomasi RCC1774 TaxID=1764569 RepID=A0A2W1JV69_9CYAN|nr:phosphate ABC transporter permease subunit PstC [Acaryochloris thomasi]PZD72671.1 Phosphate transport system permease protein PstC [Acaryochloris thomasi RCC1774]
MSLYRSDRNLLVILRILSALSGAVLILIVGFLLLEALPILNQIGWWRFFSDPGWYPTSQQFNLTPMVVGTLLVTLGAVVLATPLGVLSAIFCQYYAPKAVATVYRRLIELLAGIPSVVYGFWGLVVLVPMIGRLHPPGPSLLAGMLILAVMILPTVMLVTDSSLAAIPPHYWKGSQALGLGTWATVQGVCLPAARSGLITGVMLATARALGETLAVLMVCGNIVQVPQQVFDPVRTLTANIALEMAYALEQHRAALFVSGLVLMIGVTVLVLVSELLQPQS